eukprot:5967574-Amphidinium_carterae.2
MGLDQRTSMLCPCLKRQGFQVRRSLSPTVKIWQSEDGSHGSFTNDDQKDGEPSFDPEPLKAIIENFKPSCARA